MYVPRCTSLLRCLRLAFPLFIWPLLVDISNPPSCLVTCPRATPAYSRMWPEYSPFLHCAYGVVPCSSSVNTYIHCTQNCAILSSDVCLFKSTRAPMFGRTIVPSCFASTASYYVLLMYIPLFPARKTVLYYYPKLEFSKFTMLKFRENYNFIFAKRPVTSTFDIVFDPN